MRIILQDAIANGTGAEFDEDDRLEHSVLGLREQLLDHLPEPESPMGDVLIACVEVLEAEIAWLVAQPNQHRNPECECEQSWEEEDPPVLVDAGVAGAKQRLERLAPEVELVLVDLRTGSADERVAQVEREVNAERNHEAEQRRERPTMTDMEPGHLGRDDRHGRAALEEHVERVQDENRPEQREIPSQHRLSVQEYSDHGAGDHGAEDAVEHAPAATATIDDRAVDHEAHEVEERAAAEDVVEVAAGHARVAKRAFGRVEHVAHEHHAGVPEPEREPVEKPTPFVSVGVDGDALCVHGKCGRGHGNLRMIYHSFSDPEHLIGRRSHCQ